ncbi:TerD family protein [Rhodococcus zopfii]|uniref:TerD family protein n=1 Tax=Rhodococcus zopfii TaxID=43772 RepID=A0ABU3WUG2_9NOCA|nr:TerD family protein [Rhodococcus zopfii]
MSAVSKGSKTDLADLGYEVVFVSGAPAGVVDLIAVLLTAEGRVRSDEDFVFFNNPKAPGFQLTSDTSAIVDLSAVPSDIHRVLVAASTEAQGQRFGDVPGLRAEIRGARQTFEFTPPGLTTETVLQVVAFYRRGAGWRLDAVGQGYQDGLAAFATDHGIVVDEPGAAQGQSAPAGPPAAVVPPRPAARPISFEKVQVSLTKDSADKTARIDLRKSQGDPNWVLTVGLEWDGRGATYDRSGKVNKYGEGDLDVYFYCRNEHTNDYVVISGDRDHRGDLGTWPFIHHYGDSKGPGRGKKPAVEQVRVLPNENGDLLVNIYQSVDNGIGAIDKFGRPRVAIRYGRAGKDGLPGPDADEILVYVGNGKNAYWATVAHIDVQDGVLTVDGETRYSRIGSERMPGLDSKSTWVRSPKGGPTGRSKKRNGGLGLDRYHGTCPR